MIHGQKVIAFTPCGRKRYMDLLAGNVMREHERGHIDQWILFNNAYKYEDSTYADQLAEHFPWCKVLREHKDEPQDKGRDGKQFTWARPEQIANFYKQFTESENCIYFRLDDDIIYIDEECLPRLITYRINNPKPYLVYPVIVNNVRTSYHLQQQGVIPKTWGEVKDEMCDVTAWKDENFVRQLHMKALAALKQGKLRQEFPLRTEQFTDWEAGHISINCFAMFGKDMLEAKVEADEEGYLSLWKPKELNRQNARCGDAVVIHFAYHTQTEYMDGTGMLSDYARLVPALPFQTHQLA